MNSLWLTDEQMAQQKPRLPNPPWFTIELTATCLPHKGEPVRMIRLSYPRQIGASILPFDNLQIK